MNYKTEQEINNILEELGQKASDGFVSIKQVVQSFCASQPTCRCCGDDCVCPEDPDLCCECYQDIYSA